MSVRRVAVGGLFVECNHLGGPPTDLACFERVELRSDASQETRFAFGAEATEPAPMATLLVPPAATEAPLPSATPSVPAAFDW